jgi:FolB domain-containing protein
VSAVDGADILEIVGLRVPCIIGIHPEERHTPQDLILGVRLHLDVDDAATTTRLEATVDYARLAGELTFILQSGRFLLIESAAVAVARAVLHGQPLVAAVDVVLEKPAALGGHGVPRLQVSRRRAPLPPPSSPLVAPGVEGVLLHGAGGDDDRSLHRLAVAGAGALTLPTGSIVWDVDAGRAGAALTSPGLVRAGLTTRHYVVALGPSAP